MKSAEEFLAKVLPSKGRYCVAAFYKNSKGARHFWCTSIEELAKQIELKDSNADAVYHACASYGELKNAKGKIGRTKENVLFLRSLYCEVDIREGEKGYNTKEEALAACAAFLEATSLPRPTIIDSGGGYHFYWHFNQDVTRDVWERYAKGLKTLAAKWGFKVDVGITADAARILRTPGTTNRKYDNVIVRSLCDGDIHPVSRFQLLLLQNPKPIKIETPYTKTIYDTDLIVSKCNQLAILRDNPTSQDGVTWLACARTLAETTNGEQFFHEHSSKDPRYDADEAAKKWAESVKHGKGVTCEHFATINPSGCEGCPFRGKIKTPLHIGRGSNFHKLPDEVSEVLKIADMPIGFRFDETGKLMYVTEKQNDAGEAEEKYTYVHEFPIIVEDRYVSEVTQQDYRIALKHWQPHDGWKTVHVDAADFLRNTEAAFGGKGVFSQDDKLLKRYVKQSLNMIATKRAASMSYESFGWKEQEGKKSFLLGYKLIQTTAKDANGNVELFTETVALTEAATRIAAHIGPGGMRKKGSFKNQQLALQSLCAPGHEWQLCTVISSCAAILMPLVLQSEGGLIWSTYDYKGGAGKTLAATAAATIWGDLEGLATTASDTPKSRVAALGVLRHLPQIYDEMKRTDPQLAREHIQIFTSGREGTRLTQGGDFQKHLRNWCTIMITSSNQELKGAVEAAEGSKAMLSRIFEVQANELPLSKKEFKESFKHEFLNNPGFMGEMFVKATVFLEGMGTLYEMFDKAEAQLIERYTFDAQQRFKLAYFICMYVASHILVEAGLLSFSPERVMTWLLEDNNNNWNTEPRIEMTEILAMYMHESLRRTLVVNGEFVRKPLMISRAPTDELAIRIEETGNIFLGRQQLIKWLQTKDISFKHFAEELEKAGAVKSAKAKRSLGAGTAYGVGQSWCMIVDGRHEDIASIIAEDNVIDLEAVKKQLQSGLALS